MPLFQELQGLGFPCIFVVLANAEGETDTFEVNLLLVRLGFTFFFFLLEEKGTEIKYFTNRRPGHRGNLNEVQSFRLGQSERLASINNTEGFTCFVDHCDLGYPDEVIDAEAFSTDGREVTYKLYRVYSIR